MKATVKVVQSIINVYGVVDVFTLQETFAVMNVWPVKAVKAKLDFTALSAGIVLREVLHYVKYVAIVMTEVTTVKNVRKLINVFGVANVSFLKARIAVMSVWLAKVAKGRLVFTVPIVAIV